MRRLGSVLLVAALLLTVAPSAVPPTSAAGSTPIMGRSVLIADQLAAWFASTGRSDRLDGLSVGRLARLFVEEGAKEGVRGELAFAQTIFETGFLQFSERFPPECHNYAGIGGTQTRHCFDTARLGVRAQIQHLRAYADPTVGDTGTASTNVDPRFHLVSPKGVAPTVEDLSGRWAPGEDYGEKIVRIYRQIRDHAGPTLRDRPLGARIAGAASPPGSGGLYLVDRSGGIFALGGVPFRGSMHGLGLSADQLDALNVVGIAAAPDGSGYWLVNKDGAVFAFGGAEFYGNLPELVRDGTVSSGIEVAGIAPSASGRGYYLFDVHGGVFAFGDAEFRGSVPELRRDHGKVPLIRATALVPVASGSGYWIFDDHGGAFAFGDARFRGSAAEADLDMVGAIPSADGVGYRIVSDDGAVIAYT